MPTVVTRTIGVGRDYVNFTAAEADVENIATSAIGGTDLVANDGAIVFEADAGTYSESVTFQSSLTTDATRQVTYKPAAGSEHGGVLDGGVLITQTSSPSNYTLGVGDNFTKVFGLGLQQVGTSRVVSAACHGFTLDSCVIESDTTTTRCLWVNWSPTAPPAGATNTISNNVFINGYVSLWHNGGSSGVQFDLINNTHTGLEPQRNWDIYHVPDTSYNVVNNLVTNPATSGFGTWLDQGGGGTATITGSNNFGGSFGPFPAAIQGSPYPITPSKSYDPGVGDFALYVGSTGELLDSPNNDVVNQGVGPAANSDVPTTDIKGNTRSGTTANPGAFEQLNSLTTVTRTIGSGKDYANFIAAEADVVNIATSAIGSGSLLDYNGAIVFEADAGDYTESFTFFTGGALTCDPTRNVTWTCASGAGHGGKFASGANIIGAISLQESFAIADGFSVTPSTGGGGGIGGEAVGVILRNLMSYSTNNRAFTLSRGGSAAFPNVVENCVGKSDSSRAFDIRADGAESYWRVVNCTAMATGINQGFIVAQSSSDTINLELVNNVVNGGTARSYFASPGPTVVVTGSNNFGPDDGSAPFPAAVQGSPYPVTPTIDLDPGAGDFLVYWPSTGALVDVSGNDVWQQGVGPSVNSDVPTTDIEGVARSGATANPGAFEADGFDPPTVITKTVGIGGAASGYDYADFPEGLADIDTIAGGTDLVSLNTAIVFEADAGIYNGFVMSPGGVITDATRNITLKAAAGQGHGGQFGQGVIIRDFVSVTNYNILNSSYNHIIYDGLSFLMRNGSNSEGLEFRTADGCIVRNCMFDQQNQSTDCLSTNVGGGGSSDYPIRIENCVGLGRRGAFFRANSSASRACHHELINNTFMTRTNTAQTDYGTFFHDNLSSGATNTTLLINNFCTSKNSYKTSGTGLRTVTGSNNFGQSGTNSFPFGTRGTPEYIIPTADFDIERIPWEGAADYAVYTYPGALIDTSANSLPTTNDIWQKGVGPTANSEVPATDINGVSRTGSVCNPGAFEADGFAEPTVVTYIIDDSGNGNYTTIAAAEADLDNNTFYGKFCRQNEKRVFEIRTSKSDSGVYQETVVFNFGGSESTGYQDLTDSTRKIVIKAAADSQHNGNFGQGVRWTATASYGTACSVDGAVVDFDGINFESLSNSGRRNGVSYSYSSDRNRAAVGSVTNCLYFGSSSSNNDRALVVHLVGASNRSAGYSWAPITVKNCVAHGMVPFIYAYGLSFDGVNSYIKAVNNTVRTMYGVSFQPRASTNHTLHVEMINNVFTQCPYSGGYATYQGAFLIDNAQGAGTNFVYNVSGSNNFGEPANSDFVTSPQRDLSSLSGGVGLTLPVQANQSIEAGVSAGICQGRRGRLVNLPANSIWDQGLAPSANSDIPTTDIQGITRVVSASATNLGAYVSDGYQSVSSVTKTIDVNGGGDYTSFAEANTDFQNVIPDSPGEGNTLNSLTENNLQVIWEVKAGDYPEAPQMNEPTAFQADETRNLVVRAATEEDKHKGIPTKGIRITNTGLARVHMSFIDVNDIEFNRTTTTITRPGIKYTDCLFNRNGTPFETGYDVGTATFPLSLKNCVFRHATEGQAVAIQTNSAGQECHVEFINCSWLGWHRTVGSTTGGHHYTKFVNCIIHNPLYAILDQNTGSITYTGGGNYGVASNPFPVEIQGSQYPIVPVPFDYETVSASGDESVYGRGTARLANVPGSNSWQAGIGPSVSAIVPLTDIAGEARSGATANPGAFEIPLTIPEEKTIIGKSVDPFGDGDYTTPGLAEADIFNIFEERIGHNDLIESNSQLDVAINPGVYPSVTFQYDTTFPGPDNYINFSGTNLLDRPIFTSNGCPVSIRCNFLHLDGYASSSTHSNDHAIKLFSQGIGVKTSRGSHYAYNTNPIAYFSRSGDVGSSKYPIVHENNEYKSVGSVRSECLYLGGGSTFSHNHKIINCQANPDECTTDLVDSFIRLTSTLNGNITVLNNLNLRNESGDFQIETIYSGGDFSLSGSNNVGVSDNDFIRRFSTYGLGNIQASATTSLFPPLNIPHSIYEASSNKLVDSTRNDAWKQGIGPSLNSEIDVFDIEGRTRAVYDGLTLTGYDRVNPGAYEVDTDFWTPPTAPATGPTDGPGAFPDLPLQVNFVGDASTLNTSWTEEDGDSRSRRYPTREGDVREKIFKMTQAKSNISFIYKESLRSMIASFNDIGYFNSEDAFVGIKCIHGNAERTIAKLKQENSIILPIVSISQTISDNDDQRRRYESVLVHEKYWDSDKHRAVRVISLAPRPVNIKYQVNIWCKYMADMDQILEQIRLKFNPEMDVPTTYSTLAKASVDSEEAVGSMSAKDKEDRIIKKTLNVTLKTYIPSPKFIITSTGEIEELNILKD